jgi:hypothetical protein
LSLKDQRSTPGPGHNHVSDDTVRAQSPSYSFGTKLEDKRYFSDTLVYGQQGFSPGPKYNLNDEKNNRSASPSYTFGGVDREDIYGIGYKTEEPGPGDYEHKNYVSKETYSYTFGSSTRDGSLIFQIILTFSEKKYFSDKLASHMIGDSSPGPIYYPETNQTKEKSPSHGFGHCDRAQSFTPSM